MWLLTLLARLFGTQDDPYFPDRKRPLRAAIGRVDGAGFLEMA
jgi:hypothetical protein